MKAHLFAAALLVSTASLAAAQTATPGIDAREVNQQKRIGAGLQDGSLTAKEAVRLEKGQARVQRMEDRAKADGVVTANERARMQQQQNIQSRRIYDARHNNRTQ